MTALEQVCTDALTFYMQFMFANALLQLKFLQKYCLGAWRTKAPRDSALLQLKGQVQETKMFGESEKLMNGVGPFYS